MTNDSLKLGTRGSKLAVAQSSWVARQITQTTGVPVELVIIQTKGDVVLDKPLAEIGGKGLFTYELEQALLNSTIDFAVHSCKDLPTENPAGLHIACYPKREDPRDVLVGGPLLARNVVGTGSARRQAQISKLQMVEFKGIRGNVDTRILKMESGGYDRVVLAMAGLKRLEIQRDDVFPLSVLDCVPAPAQGALALQVNSKRADVIEIIEKIQCQSTKLAVEAEREFLHIVGGGCHAALGAYLEHTAGKEFLLHVFYQSNETVFKRSQKTTSPLQLAREWAYQVRREQ